MENRGAADTYEHAVLSSESLTVYTGCVSLPQLRKSVETFVGRNKKRKVQSFVDYELDQDTPLGIRIGHPSFHSNIKPSFNNEDASSLYILNDPTLTVGSKLNDVIDAVSSYLSHYNNTLQKPTSAQMKPSFGITNLPESMLGYDSIPNDVIFAPTNGSDAIAAYGGSNTKHKKSIKKHVRSYPDTHNNSLLGRDNSQLTLIKDDAEWASAKSNNLICFSQNESLLDKDFGDLSSVDNTDFDYALMDIGINVKKLVANKVGAVGKKNSARKQTTPPPTFVQVFIREPCAYSNDDKSDLKTTSTKTSQKSIWIYCGCSKDNLEEETTLDFEVFKILIFEGLLAQNCKYDIGVSSKVFVADKSKTGVLKANEVQSTENLKSRLLKLDRIYLDGSKCTYVVFYLSFGQCSVYTSTDKINLDKVNSLKKQKFFDYSTYADKCVEEALDISILKKSSNLMNPNDQANIFVQPDTSLIEDLAVRADDIAFGELSSPFVIGEKMKMGAKSITLTGTYKRIVALLNTTPNSPYYHSMTDVMGRSWVDHLIAKGANRVQAGDDSITAEALLAPGFLTTRGWIPDLNNIIYKKEFNGLKPKKDAYPPTDGSNYMSHSDARKLQKGLNDDEDIDTSSESAILLLAKAVASQKQIAQPTAIDFIRIFSDKTTYSVTTKKLDFSVDTLTSLLSRDALGEQQYNTFFDFTKEEYKNLENGTQELVFKFELAPTLMNSSSSTSESTKYRIFRSDVVSSTLKAINIDAPDLLIPRTCSVCLENKKQVSQSTFSFKK
jgi:hypothetical protein